MTTIGISAPRVVGAVKSARAYTGRSAVVAFDHAYHGRTNLTMALTAKSMPYESGFGPFAPEVYRAALSYPYRDGKEMEGEQAARRAFDVIETQVGAVNLAAVVIAPIRGEGGFIVPAEGVLPAPVQWCRANGVVFIADEVQSGFARTGAWFASEHSAIVPDLVVTAKGLAGGLPLSGVTGRTEIMDAAHVGGLGGTYGGNPLACAAASAATESVVDDGLLDRATEIGRVILPRLHRMQAEDSRIGDVRGIGAMIAVEGVHRHTTDPDPELAKLVVSSAYRQGVILLTCGTYGNVVRLLPPLSISDGLRVEALDVCAAVLDESDERQPQVGSTGTRLDDHCHRSVTCCRGCCG